MSPALPADERAPRTSLRPARPARPVVRDTGSWLLRAAILAGCGLLAWFWWAGTSPAAGGTPGRALIAVGELVGLLGSFLVCVLLLLVARVPWVERAVGMDRLVQWHRSLGTAVVLLVCTHVLAMVVGGMLVDRTTPWSELGTLLATTPDLLVALVGTGLFLLVGTTSARLLRSRLPYEWWFGLHLTVYVGIYLAFWHQIAGGTHLAGTTVARAAWTALYLATAAAILGWRVVAPLVRHARAGWRVDALVPEADGVTSVWLRGRHDEDARAGQFYLVRFLARGHLGTAHPYSLSALPAGGRLRFTVGELGDHSSAVRHLRPGTRVVLEGPFGRCTADLARSRRVLLVAGGAGIGPVRALAEELVATGRDVVVLHRARSAGRLALAAEFPVHASLRYVPVAGRRSELGHDPLTAARIATTVPDVRERDVFVCGPEAMTDAVVRAVRRLGVPRSAVHHEELSLA
ncbi:ferric reductase-like transmembrane domain-containing protein [Cellulomonas sp. HZM]|uniref:ferredoxin reductase family protein n=1 Tax=Cellulomonas sp. HZM TaxID=1454010 RepID=UPI000AD087FA|nr:ferredoxin reductase family protein [Cellulomonas sp. HZM]